jgi:ankyrin repeat protein
MSAQILQDELFDAIEWDDSKRLQQVLALGADPNLPLACGITPLYAATLGSDPIASAASVRCLLDAGAHCHTEISNDGHTSVHSVADSGKTEVLKLLVLKAGGDRFLETFDYISRTPLICAAHNGHAEAARFLVSVGADVNARDEANAGDPAISWAVREKNEVMVTLLLEAGADPTLRGWMRLSAIDRASDWHTSTWYPALRRMHEMLTSATRGKVFARRQG